jgi:hypothetical protein
VGVFCGSGGASVVVRVGVGVQVGVGVPVGVDVGVFVRVAVAVRLGVEVDVPVGVAVYVGVGVGVVNKPSISLLKEIMRIPRTIARMAIIPTMVFDFMDGVPDWFSCKVISSV